MVLKFVFHIIILIIIIWPICLQASAKDIVMAQPGCNMTCGGVVIPYPKCYADSWFEIECRNSTASGGEKPHLKSIDLEVNSFDVTYSRVVIKNPIFRWNCGRKDSWPIKNLGSSSFAYSQVFNKFVAVGCNNIALLQSNGSDVSGCVSICNEDVYDYDIGKVDLGDTECHGMKCCETTLPSYLQEYNVTTGGLNGDINGCGYALIVEDYRNAYASILSYVGGHIMDLDEVPAVLEWEIPYTSTFKPRADAYAECYVNNINSSQHRDPSGWTCSCIDGFNIGNRYIVGSCTGMIFVPTKINGCILG